MRWYMMEIGDVVRKAGNANLFIQTALYIKESGETTKKMVMDAFSLHRVACMKVNLRMVTSMVKVLTRTPMVPYTEETSKVVKEMAVVFMCTLMVSLSIAVISRMENPPVSPTSSSHPCALCTAFVIAFRGGTNLHVAQAMILHRCLTVATSIGLTWGLIRVVRRALEKGTEINPTKTRADFKGRLGLPMREKETALVPKEFLVSI